MLGTLAASGGVIEIPIHRLLPAAQPQSEPRRERMHLVDDGEIEQRPDPEWVIEELIPQGGVVLMYGDSGTGKTFVALDMALCVRAGLDWHGRSTKGPSVLFIEAESPGGLKKRLISWKAAHGVERVLGAKFLDAVVALSNPRDVDELLAAMGKTHNRYALVVVDTVARAFGHGDENSATDVMAFLAGAQRIAKETGAAVLLIHHSNKDGVTYRGSSALFAGVETVIRVSRAKSGVRLVIEKQRDAEPGKAIALRLAKHGDSLVPESFDGEVLDAADDRVPEQMNEAIRVLHQLDPDGNGVRYKDWLQATQMPPATFDRQRKVAVRLEYVRHIGNRYYVAEKGLVDISPKSDARREAA